MDKVMEYAPPALEIMGICLAWALKAFGLAIFLALLVMWNLMRIAVMGFFFGRLPRSMVRVFD